MNKNDVLLNLVVALEQQEDSTAMPDGSEGDGGESWWSSGNFGRAEIDLARIVAKVGLGQGVPVVCIAGSCKGEHGIAVRVTEKTIPGSTAAAPDIEFLEIVIVAPDTTLLASVNDGEFSAQWRVVDESCKNTYPECFAESEQEKGEIPVAPGPDRIIKLGVHGIEIGLYDGEHGTTGELLRSDLERMMCPSCSQVNCVYSCDGSQGANECHEDDLPGRLLYNGLLEGTERKLVADACAGINVESDEYLQALQTVLDSAANQYIN